MQLVSNEASMEALLREVDSLTGPELLELLAMLKKKYPARFDPVAAPLVVVPESGTTELTHPKE